MPLNKVGAGKMAASLPPSVAAVYLAVNNYLILE